MPFWSFFSGSCCWGALTYNSITQATVLHPPTLQPESCLTLQVAPHKDPTIKAHTCVSQQTLPVQPYLPLSHPAAADLPIMSFIALSQESLTSLLCLLTVGTHLNIDEPAQPFLLGVEWFAQLSLRKSPKKSSLILHILLTLLCLHCE